MISEYFKDNKGKKSMMRLLCFLSFFAAVLFGILAIYNPIVVSLSVSFLTGAFAPKAMQKFMEQKIK